MPEIEHDLARPWRNSEKGRISSTWILITQSCWNQNYLDPFEKQRLWKSKQNLKFGILTSWLGKGFPNCSHTTVSGVLTAYVPRLISPSVWYSVSLFVAHLLALPVMFEWFSVICLWQEDIAECTSKCAVALSHYNLCVECYYFLTKAPITVSLHNALVTCTSNIPYRASWY